MPKKLCDHNAGYGTLQCYPDYGAGRCPGAANSNCYPYVVWSSKLVGDSNAWSPELNGGRFFEYVGDAGHIKTNAFTVRCVLDMDTQKASKCSALISTGSQRKSGLHKISQDSANGVCYHLNTIMLVQNMGKSCNVNIKTSSVTRGPATALCSVMQA